MSSEYRETVTTVFCDVLENLAFMFGDEVPREEIPPVTGEYVRAQMTFDGAFVGALLLAVPTTMCPEIAANVLGLDPDDEMVATVGEDALKELLNVICGRVLTEVAGEEPVFDLSVPEVETLTDDAWQALLASPDTIALMVDEEPVLLRLEVTS